MAMDDLEIEWGRLKLTQGEEEVVVVDEEVPDDRREEIALSLVGKLLSQTNINVTAMKTVFKNIWRPAKGLVIRN